MATKPKSEPSPARLRDLIRQTHRHGVMLAALNRKRRRKLNSLTRTARPAHREGIDYVSMTVKEVRATGAKFVMRYLSHDPSKDIDASEIHALRAIGIAIGFVWETTATRATAGFNAGVEDATNAKRRMQAFGVPLTVPCFFAVDFDAEATSIASYFVGVRHVMGARTGVYGSIRVVNACHANGIRWCWQTYAWSNAQWSPFAQLQQYRNGPRFDHNRTITVNAGLWEA